MSEARDKAQEALVAAATKLHDYNTFLNSKEMRELSAELQEAMDSLQKTLLAPMKSVEDALERNFVLGRINGLLTLSMLAETKRSTYQEAHDKLSQEISDAAKRSSGPGDTGRT